MGAPPDEDHKYIHSGYEHVPGPLHRSVILPEAEAITYPPTATSGSTPYVPYGGKGGQRRLISILGSDLETAGIDSRSKA